MNSMSTTLNPFPAYPVVRLLDGLDNIKAITVDTDAIKASREFVDQYVKQWKVKYENIDTQINPVIVAIKGDYGTGKTHLLLDAAASLTELLNKLKSSPVFIRVTCISADPVTWYRAVIGPTLMQPFVSEAIVGLYARAGQDIAAEARLTEAAVTKLTEDPTLIHSLVRDNLLSPSAVNGRFDALLEQICKDCGTDVRRAFSALVWGETADAALQWLAGKSPSEYELEKLGISRPLALDVEANGVIVGLAAIHAYLGRPFGLMIDEMEHLTQYDLSQGNRNNLNWLKRLLESLSTQGSLVYVAGHRSAWENEVQSDYLDRFSQIKPITLWKLTATDIVNIVCARVPNLASGAFDEANAQAIIEMTGGNMRKVMSLCHQLFKKTDGYSQSFGRELIISTAVEIGQRKSLDEIMLGVHELLENFGLRIGGELEGGWQFDVIAYSGDVPRVVAEFKHTITQAVQRGIARRSFDRIGELQKRFPDVIGLFFFDGSIDDEQLAVLSSVKAAGIYYFDLGQSELLSEVSKVLRTHLEISSENQSDGVVTTSTFFAPPPTNERKEQEDRQQPSSINIHIADLMGKTEAPMLSNEKIQRQLDELEKKRAQELKLLQDHITSLSDKLTTTRDKEAINLDMVGDADQQNLIYRELTRPIGAFSNLSNSITNYSLSSNLILLYLITCGVISLLFVSDEKQFFYMFEYLPDRTVAMAKQLIFVFGFMMQFASLSIIFNRMIKLNKYYEFSCRMLRQLYLRRASTMDMTKADMILKESIEKGGERNARKLALEGLNKAFPGVFNELLDNYSD